MTRRIGTVVAVLALYAGLTVALTWPQTARLSTHVSPFDDSLLNIWRISWLAHAIGDPSTSIADGNIFYPERRTLAYTDAVPLQGLVAAPFIALGAAGITVYNVILLASMALSGAAMCLLVRRLTGQLAAGLVAGVIFAFVPFRFDHFMHLELQATVFMPLALWCLDRALETRRWGDVLGFAGAMVLQLLSGIYYTVFLAVALAIAVPFRLRPLAPAERRQLLRRLAIVTAGAALVAAAYLSVYLQNRTTVGERSVDEVRRYSATVINYLATGEDNLVHGRWSHRFGAQERRLNPGALAAALALVGVAGWQRRKTTLAILGVTGFVLSLGANTPLYEVLRDVVVVFRGLRAPARASILVFFAIAAFAGYGWAAIVGRRPRWRLVGTTAVMGLLCLEYITVLHSWLALPADPPAVARWLARQPRQVIVELPLPVSDRLAEIHDGLFMYASTFHWQPMLNGYSGFYPKSYIELIEVMRRFPAPDTIEYLKRRNVDLMIVHGSYLKPDALGELAARLASRPDLQVVAEFPEAGGPDLVYRLRR
jgi:hypothetical protein